MSVIEVHHVDKRRDGRRLLAAIDFAVEEGEAFGLMGANGSGKSLLLRLVAALERPDRGRIAVLGWNSLRSASAVRRAVGFAPDRPVLLRGLSVQQQLDFLAECRGLRREERKAAVESLLELVDLDAQRNSAVTLLSRGQQQRLSLASAMVHDPAVLLCDEPFAGLDGAGRAEMQEVLRELCAMGKTLLVASNNPADIAHLCTNVGWLRQGRLAPGTMQDVLDVWPTESGESEQEMAA